MIHVYSKTCLKQPLEKDKTKILMTSGSLMKVESIAECSHWTFTPALCDNGSCVKTIFGLLFEWMLKTGFTAYVNSIELNKVLKQMKSNTKITGRSAATKWCNAIFSLTMLIKVIE